MLIRATATISTAPIALALLVSLAACQEIPSDVEGFESRCIQLNLEEIPPAVDDPHKGYKSVYACDVAMADVQAAPPWPDGSLIVKSSRRGEQDFPWLVATARKTDGAWSWAEFTRNFADEPLLEIGASEQLCIDCHKAVEAVDWIFTHFEGSPATP